MKTHRLKGILIDLDDTLYAYGPCNKAALNKCIGIIAKKYAMNSRAAGKLFLKARRDTKNLAGKTGASHSRLLYFKRATELMESRTNGAFALKLDSIFWKKYLEKMKVKRGAKAFLKECRKNNFKVAIVTNLTTEIQLKKIKKLGMDQLVDFMVTSEEAGAEKPAPHTINTALKRINCNRHEAIFIGDRHDTVAAKNAGIRFCLAEKDADWENIMKTIFSGEK